MKHYLGTFSKLAVFLSALAGATSAFAAGSGYSEYLSSIDLKRDEGIHIDVILKNTSTDKHVNSVNIQPTKNSFDLELVGKTRCSKDRKVTYVTSKLYLGGVSLFVDTILDQGAHNLGTYEPTFEYWGGSKWITEAGNLDPFVINLAQVKNLAADIRIDPVGEFNKKLASHVNSGKDKLSFLQSDQYLEITRPMTLASSCRKFLSAGHVPSKWGFKTVDVKFVVRYQGDPDLHNKARLNPSLAGSQSNGQYNQDLPLDLTEANFQPNMPHYIGKCAPDEDPIIRVNFKGSGSGKVRLKIEESGHQLYYSNDLLYDSKKAQIGHFDVKYPLIAKLAQKPEWGQINSTINHPLKIKARVQNKGEGEWSDWEDFGQAVWRHRCTPQITVPTPNGSKKAFDNTPPKPRPARQTTN